MHVATNFMGFTISGRGGVNHGATATTSGHRDAMAGRSLNDVLTLSSKAGKVISEAENKIASLDPANARDAIRIARLEDKIMQVLEKLIAKAAAAGITIIVENPSEAVAATPVAAEADSSEAEAASPSPKDNPSVASIPKSETAKPETAKPETAKPETAKPETAKPETGKPETAAVAVAKPATAAIQAANGNVVEKLTGLERAAANAADGAGAENAKILVAKSNANANANANATAKEQGPAPKSAAPEKAAGASEPANTSPAAKKMLVIKAAVLREVRNFEDLIALVSGIEGAVARISNVSADDVTKQVSESVSQAYLDRAGVGDRDQQVRSLQTHKQVVDLITTQMDAITRMQDSSRKSLDFIA